MELPDALGRRVSNANEVMADSKIIAHEEDARLQRFREWLQVNGVQSRCCEIRPISNGEHAGLGLFATQDNAQGVLMVTPLLLAITPMTVLQDPLVGLQYCKLMEEGEVDDRLLIMLFLLIEYARGQSSFWAPYLDMLPSKFGTPLCYSEEELLELKGTPLFQATQQQARLEALSRILHDNTEGLRRPAVTRIKFLLNTRRALNLSFNDKVKAFADTVLSSVESERREVEFQDFMWANSVFWTRALNIPCPYSIVFPAQLPVPPALGALQFGNESTGQQPDAALSGTTDFQRAINHLESYSGTESKVEDELTARPSLADKNDMAGNEASKHRDEFIADSKSINEVPDFSVPEENYQFVVDSDRATNCRVEELSQASTESVEKPSTVWVEGLVPGIDFCNHDHKAVALWEVDGPQGCVTGVPNSMYLVTGPELGIPSGSEILISYGNKGNEELLYLYGFVMENNPDDYLMVYFPKQALEDSVCSDTKSQLLEELKLPLRWLLPSSELKRGFYEESNSDLLSKTQAEPQKSIITGYSWSGHRKATALAENMVFPEDLLTAFRIVAMNEDEVNRVVAMLEEISDPEVGRIPTDVDIKAAVWEACGNAGALQLLVDLLTFKMMEIEEGTGTEDMDIELLAKDSVARSQTKEQEQGQLHRTNGGDRRLDCDLMSENKRACVIYRLGQKRLARRFLQEAEMALDVCIDEF